MTIQGLSLCMTGSTRWIIMNLIVVTGLPPVG